MVLEDGLREYLKTHVRTQRQSCAYTALANAANRAGDVRSYLPAEIGTVVNLSWRGETFRWARDQGFELFRTFPRSPGDNAGSNPAGDAIF